MRFRFTADPDEFSRQAEPFIEKRLDCNVIGGILDDIRAGVYSAGARFAYGIDDRDEVAFVALRTPPRGLVVSPLPAGTEAQFLERWLEHDPRLPGVNSLIQTARAIADAWAASTGGSAQCRMRQAMHTLTEVYEPARPAPGKLRAVRRDELAVAAAWWEEFVRETGVGLSGEALTIVAARRERGALHVWDDDGPSSLVGIAATVAGVARIGPVYTPPDRRRHGYATSAVAALSRLALARGAHTCMLYTDLANPTSNKIYAELGYRRFAEWEEYVFEPAGRRARGAPPD